MILINILRAQRATLLKLKSMKKILAIFGALAVALVAAPAFMAFEAHVVNVTAQIENALSVNTEPINFGTVFPQEQLDRQFRVALSSSFLSEDRVDDVEYFIRQKPKCGWTDQEGEVLVGGTVSGHVDDQGNMTCLEPTDNPDPVNHPNATFGVLPLLCDYLSKHELTEDGQETDNDGSLLAFHRIGEMKDHDNDLNTPDQWVWNDVTGRLAKSAPDTEDTWNLDLKVPCFGGYCAQDWADFVHGINPNVDPDDYVQDILDEHKVFGCDLWVEVSGVSEAVENGPTGT